MICWKPVPLEIVDAQIMMCPTALDGIPKIWVCSISGMVMILTIIKILDNVLEVLIVIELTDLDDLAFIRRNQVF